MRTSLELKDATLKILDTKDSVISRMAHKEFNGAWQLFNQRKHLYKTKEAI